MRRLTACTCLALSLSVAGCGTTVPLSATSTAGRSASGADLSPGALPTGANDPAHEQSASQPSVGAAVGPRGAASGASTGQATGALTPGPITGGTAGALVGRGVTATTITIGAAIPTGTAAAGKALGISGAGSVEESDIWKAVIAAVNRSGGVLGRKLVLYNHSVDVASFVANPAQTYAEVCADFRDDHKVFAAMIYVADPILRKCFADMGTPFILYGAITTVPAVAYEEHGANFFYAPSSITQERLAQLFVQSLVARSFTSMWDTANGGPGLQPVKLGLIHADTPDQNNLYAAYTRELEKHGLRFTDTVTYSGDASTALAATQSAVLKFRSEGITHVFGASAFFLRDAESQHYRPRYAFLPGLGALGASNSPAAQLKGALTVGWSPTQDVNAEQDPGPTPGAARCSAIMRAAGLTGNRQDLKLMYAVCDAISTLREALTAGGAATVPGLRRGFEAVGTHLSPALTFAALLAPHHHYGVDSVRDMAFDAECGCLKYTSRSSRS